MRVKSILGAGVLLGLGVTLGGIAVSQTAPPAPNAAAVAARAEIERTLGSVPGMFRQFPDSGIAGAWAEFRDVQLNGNTALSGRMKELIGLAVSAQIPCSYCVYFHTRAARLNGASDEEIRETIAMAAITRHWSTVLNGIAQDPAEFRREADAIFARAEATARQAPPAAPAR